MSERIDIAVNESGVSKAVRDLEDLADICQGLSPSLAKSLRGRALRVGVNTDRAVRMVSAKILDKVVRTTPVDTGAARGNWEVNVSAGPPELTPSRDRTDREGGGTVAAGIAVISSARRPGQTIWISNGLEYITELDAGSSGQAPAGMTAQAILAGKNAASNINLLGD